ncbi:YcxB family protein [Ethanoligenens harbinense]|uniref:YcxB-like protein domain-containing protein n=1 Tax=Ethanoligenens harbinense (strain DSM 18485 / JCM 12961 / CGMCC 1.5033 / YUAN-3) TaxID=663278 RepID=E6U3Q1_ETHHY|nr:YcxB family protein [Ethanoligenens harbinense]ADU27651.1 hypothetical protein Ethha_2134 [Ethanoligenens harbinense YUAN-3]AVQ96687.1 hypothetical protein CXQ68_10930 [Ethanoligenens harbinense YUAN-3]AYF39347.1 hypothetical protein CXP51_10820 [Ethanoligenens harbinense]AYF42172.1 hypothetical protein CN246_11370 [Ethanoligenens harbinense]QCN92927.1 hypothetical protein DRA42_10960 [Ethanoligenens harbinense]
MELQYRLTEKDFGTCLYMLKKKTYLITTLVGGLAVLIATIFSMWSVLPETWFIAAATTVVFTVVLYFVLKWLHTLSVKHFVRKIGKASFEGLQTLSLTEEGLLDHSSLQDTKIPYTSIKSMEENNGYIVIKSSISLIFVPIKGIENPEDTVRFLATLKSKIG